MPRTTPPRQAAAAVALRPHARSSADEQRLAVATTRPNMAPGQDRILHVLADSRAAAPQKSFIEQLRAARSSAVLGDRIDPGSWPANESMQALQDAARGELDPQARQQGRPPAADDDAAARSVRQGREGTRRRRSTVKSSRLSANPVMPDARRCETSTMSHAGQAWSWAGQAVPPGNRNLELNIAASLCSACRARRRGLRGTLPAAVRQAQSPSRPGGQSGAYLRRLNSLLVKLLG